MCKQGARYYKSPFVSHLNSTNRSPQSLFFLFFYKRFIPQVVIFSTIFQSTFLPPPFLSTPPHTSSNFSTPPPPATNRSVPPFTHPAVMTEKSITGFLLSVKRSPSPQVCTPLMFPCFFPGGLEGEETCLGRGGWAGGKFGEWDLDLDWGEAGGLGKRWGGGKEGYDDQISGFEFELCSCGHRCVCVFFFSSFFENPPHPKKDLLGNSFPHMLYSRWTPSSYRQDPALGSNNQV